MHNIETLWRDYDTFENSLANKQLAKAVLQEQSQVFGFSVCFYCLIYCGFLAVVVFFCFCFCFVLSLSKGKEW